MFPEEIKGLQSRLTSRMEWGLVADMQTPDLETKVAILSKKAEANNITLDDEVSHFIASRVHTNIRQLEGALIRVDAFASLTGQQISLELAQRVLLNFNEPKPTKFELNDVATNIAKIYGVTVQELKSKRRSKNVATARQIACYVMKKLTNYSLQAIGQFFNGRDHSTIIHAITTVEKRIKDDRMFASKIKRVEEEIDRSVNQTILLRAMSVVWSIHYIVRHVTMSFLMIKKFSSLLQHSLFSTAASKHQATFKSSTLLILKLKSKTLQSDHSLLHVLAT